MSTVQKVVKNSGFLFTSSAVSGVLGFFCIIYMARHLGAHKYGILSFAITYTYLFGVLADFGLTPLVVREVSYTKSLANKYLSHLSLVKLFLFFITFLLIFITVNLLGYVAQTKYIIYIFALSIIFTSFNQMFNAFFKAFQRMEFISFGQILMSLAVFGGVMFSIIADLNLTAFAWIYCIASFFVFGYGLLVLRMKFKEEVSYSFTNFKIDYKFLKTTLKKAMPFFLSAAVSTIAFKIDIIMLSVIKGESIVGIYSVAYNILEFLLVIPTIFLGVLYPVLSTFHITSSESLQFTCKKASKFLCIISFPITICIYFLARQIIPIFYTDRFIGSEIALRVLVWTVPLIFLTYMYGIILASIDKQLVALKINASVMILNIILNFILIPQYSYVGASVATVLTSLISFILCYFYVKKNVCFIEFNEYMIKLLLATIGMGLFIYFVKINPFLSLSLSFSIYFILLFCFQVFSEEDFKLMNKAFRLKEIK